MLRLILALFVVTGCTYQAPRLAPCDGDCGPGGDEQAAAGDRTPTNDGGGGDPGSGDPGGGDPAGDPGQGDPEGDPAGGDAPTWYGLFGSDTYPFGPQQPAGGATVDTCYEYDQPHLAASEAQGGGISDTSGCSEVPSVAAAPDGALAFVWHDLSSGNWEIYGRLLDSTGWKELGADSVSGSGISVYDNVTENGTTGFPEIAIAGGMTTYAFVVWHDDVLHDGDYRIYLRRYDFGTSQWDSLGESMNAISGGVSGNAPSHRPHLAVEPAGAVVVWEDRTSSNRQVFLERYNSTAGTWEEVAGSATPGTLTATSDRGEAPRVALDSQGRIFVVWQNSAGGGSPRIYGKRSTEARDRWEEVAGSASNDGISGTGESTDPDVVIAGGEVPLVAWSHLQTGSYQIRVARLQTDAWQLVGGGPVTTGTDPVRSPSVTIAGGQAVVAWQQEVDGRQEIYLRRFDGISWVEVDGSARGGGVSRSDADSHEPRLVVTGEMLCVVWTEPAGTHLQVVMRCHDRWW